MGMVVFLEGLGLARRDTSYHTLKIKRISIHQQKPQSFETLVMLYFL